MNLEKIFRIISNNILYRLKREYRISVTTYIDAYSSIEKPFSSGRFVIIRKSKIGSYSYIANRTKVMNCIVGNFCSIGQDVKIGLGKHPTGLVSTSPLFYSTSNPFKINLIREDKYSEFEKIKIGNDVWIGSNALIMDGISIGNGSIIGANATVTRDVEPYSIVVGSPARVIKMRFEKKEIEYLERIKWWEWDLDKIRNSFDSFFDIECFIERNR